MAEEIDLYPQLGALPAFTEDGRINIPTQAAADVIAKQGSMFSADPTLQQRNNASVANFLTDTLGMDSRKAAQFSDKVIGGPRSALPFGMGLADITPMGIAYALDEAASGYAKAEEPLDYVMPTVMGALGAAETLFLGKLLATPVKGFLKSLSGKLPSQPVDVPNLPIRPSQENMRNLLDANTYGGRILGDEIVDINTLSGGSSVSKRGQDNVVDIANQMRGPKGYIERIVVDQDGSVIEGAHRLGALRSLGINNVPITRIIDPTSNINLPKMGDAIKSVGPINSDNVNQIISQVGDLLSEVGGDVGRIRSEYEFPKGFEKHFNAALNSI